MAKLNRIFGHIGRAKTDVCRRAKANVGKQGGSIDDFRHRCEREGFHCAELGEDVYAIKTDDALEEFLKEHPDAVVL